MKSVREDKEMLSENVMLAINIAKRETPDEFPEKTRWALQMSFFDGVKWVDICRIDNYLHEGQQGTHIHYSKTRVEESDIVYNDAYDKIIEIGSKILMDKFKEKLEVD